MTYIQNLAALSANTAITGNGLTSQASFDAASQAAIDCGAQLTAATNIFA